MLCFDTHGLQLIYFYLGHFMVIWWVKDDGYILKLKSKPSFLIDITILFTSFIYSYKLRP